MRIVPVAGAAAVALLMVLSPLAGASAAWPGAVVSPSYSTSTQGCAALKSASPTWSKGTGVGHWDANSSVKVCKGAGLDDVGLDNDASASFEEEVAVPIHMASGTTGVNVTWGLLGTWTERALEFKPTSCASYGFNDSYYDPYIYSWINYTYSDSDCSLDLGVSLYGYAYLVDTTTGTYYYPNNYWGGLYRDSYRYVDTYYDEENYSNSSYWQDNYTYYGSDGYISGSSGSGIFNAASSPVWWINSTSTFPSTDKWAVVTYIDGDVYADSSGGGKIAGWATLDLTTGSNGYKLGVTEY